ncbi:MAG: hypothetical protein K2Y22_11980 [Candidatus Obscuribacterales bacterium]|nr:hypothetical protein [Candidatus Obscuribacterales bacterium]
MTKFRVALAALLLAQTSAFAADVPSKTQKAVSSKPALSGQVATSTLTVSTALHAMHQVTNELNRVTTDMINEIERQQYVTVAEPDVIGPIVVPAIPMPTGGMNVGPLLPPRAKWVKLYMWQFSQVVPMLAAEIDATQIPADKKTLLAPKWRQMKALSNDITAHYQKLIPVTQGPTYVNLDIGKQLLPIYDDLKKLKELQKDAWRLANQKS